MIDYLLVNPNNKVMSPFAGQEQPLWASLYASHLISRGKSVQILDAESLDLMFEETLNTIRQISPKEIIFFLMGNNPSTSSSIKMPITDRLVKSLIGDYKVSVAGLHATALPQQTHDELGVDVLRGKIFEGTPDIPYNLLPMDKYIAHNWQCLENPDNRKPYAVTYSSLNCSFGCKFCLPENTKVLTADLLWKNIQDIKVNDRLIGVDSNNRSKFIETTVENTIQRQNQKIYKIMTENGDVYSTYEHPWLMDNRWMSIKEIKESHYFKLGSTRSVLRKVSTPVNFIENSNYRKGYLAGVASGDGSFQSQKNKGHSNKYMFHFRLVGDTDMYPVFMDYAKKEGIESHIGNYNSGVNSMYKFLNKGVYITKNGCANRLASFINKEINSKDYKIGFLSGIYDAEGSFSCNILRISSKNVIIKIRVSSYLESLGFNSILEEDSVRLLGNFEDKLRFFALVHPNVVHKKNIRGINLKNSSKIKDIAEVGLADVYNLQTSSGNFIADGFVTHNCNVGAAYGYTNKVWYRDIDKFISEIDLLVNDYGVRTFKLFDEHFTQNKKRVNDICDRLIEMNEDLNIWAYARVDTINPEMLKKMYKAGIKWVGVGFESGDNEVLGNVNKRANINQAFEAVKMIHDAKISVMGNFIVGLPKDNLQSMQKTMDLARDLNIEFINLYSYEPYPGSEAFKEKEKDWSEYGQFSKVKNPIREFRDKAFNDYFTNPKYIEHIRSWFGNQAVNEVEAMLAFGKPTTRY